MEYLTAIIWMTLLCQAAAETFIWDYVVVGAGPAGLQMGYHLQKTGRNYVILERNSSSGGKLNFLGTHN